MRRVPA
ncbi:hypothetical protein ECEC1865_6004, partial [Escherichia coli EC1865]